MWTDGGRGMFVKNSDCTATGCEPGVTRKILCYSEELMMCEITFEEGAQGYFHSHQHLQITYIVEGAFQFTVGEETQLVRKGDSIYMPSGIRHGVTCLEAGKMVDVFNPMRKEFLEQEKK